MSFPINVYLLAFAGAFLASLASLPLWRAWCRRVGHVDDPGHRKIHDQPIALAGGLAVATGFFVPIIIGALALLLLKGQEASTNLPGTSTAVGIKMPAMDATSSAPMAHGLSARYLQLGAILIGALGMVILGWYDDKHELRASVKFTGQVLIAALVAAAGVRITLFVPSVAFSYFITIFWILTLVNALNFMDNMNGLCSGLGAIGAWCFALKAAMAGQYLVATIALLASGALLGFLPFNFPKASAFLGDAGSHLVGFLLAVLGILPHFYVEDSGVNQLAVLSPLLILAVPLGDMAWVVLLRTRMGKPFWIGDTNHLSHRLVRRGLSKSTAVLVIWLLAAVFGALSFVL